MSKRIQFDAVLLPAFEIFVDQSDRSRSVKKPFLSEIRVLLLIELNGFSSGAGNATKISPAGDVFGSFFRRLKNEQLQKPFMTNNDGFWRILKPRARYLLPFCST